MVQVLVKPTDRVGKLRRDVYEREQGRIPLRYLGLEFCGKLLDDMKLVSQYELEEGDMLQVKQSEPGATLKIKTLNGLVTQILDVKQSDLVEDLKEKVMEAIDVPVFQLRLIFRGLELEEGTRVEEYGIKEGDLLHVVIRLRGD